MRPPTGKKEASTRPVRGSEGGSVLARGIRRLRESCEGRNQKSGARKFLKALNVNVIKKAVRCAGRELGSSMISLALNNFIKGVINW